MAAESRECPECREVLPLNAFHRSSRDPSGTQYRCKECIRKIRVDPKAQRRRYELHLRRVYGLGIDEYDEMVRAQGGRCAICKQKPLNGKRLVVDHDHETDAVRGLLCISCNVALGAFESEGRLLAALRYLSKFTS